MKDYRIKKIEKHLNTGLAALAAILFCIDTIAIGSFIKKTKDAKRDDIDTLKNIDFSVNYDAYEVNDMLNVALNNNIYLKDNEKELIRMNFWVFIDNKDYLDLKYIKQIISTLKINYVRKIKYENNIITETEYSHSKNEITFYSAKSLNDVDYSVFTHELYHTMQKFRTFDYNEYLIETINSIFNDEYSLGEKGLYTNYYNFTKMLMEIIGEEPFRKYQCYASADFIIDELSKIYGSKDDAYTLLIKLNKYQEIYLKSLSGNKQLIKKERSLRNELINIIDLYYKTKYGFSMENDLIMLYYYDKNKFYEIISNRFSNNPSNVVINDYNGIDYFYGGDNHTLIIYEFGPIKLKKISIGIEETKEYEEIIDDYEMIYKIDESNRYLNNSYSLKKHFN